MATTNEPELIEAEIICDGECKGTGTVERSITARPWSDDPYDEREFRCEDCNGTRRLWAEVMSCCLKREKDCTCYRASWDAMDRDLSIAIEAKSLVGEAWVDSVGGSDDEALLGRVYNTLGERVDVLIMLFQVKAAHPYDWQPTRTQLFRDLRAA